MAMPGPDLAKNLPTTDCETVKTFPRLSERSCPEANDPGDAVRMASR